jgi:hypothetical protein
MSEPPSREDFDALLAFRPYFERGEPAGVWVVDPGQLPWMRYAEWVRRFVAAAYEHGFVDRDFDWMSWSGATAFVEEPERLRTATLAELRQLLKTHIRADRFSKGHLRTMIENGHLRGILDRLAELRGSIGG